VDTEAIRSDDTQIFYRTRVLADPSEVGALVDDLVDS